MAAFDAAVPEGEMMSPSQKAAIIALERTGGCISLVAVLLIFVAYGLAREVRNVQNTFIVFASVANVGASIASIIAMEGLNRGTESSLCQAQAFLFEMFMQSDPWWSLAMAVNVFLVFYFRASPDSFQKWWWLYCVICYGGPFVIALALLVVRPSNRNLIYGEATIWCWVDREWDDIRIYTYYLLIWVCICGSIILYITVGYQVFQSRNQLRSFSTTSKGHGEYLSSDRTATTSTVEDNCSTALDDPPHAMSGGTPHLISSRQLRLGRHHGGPRIMLPDVPEDGFYGTIITEVQVVHSTPSASTVPSEPSKVHNPTVSFDNDIPDTEGKPLSGQHFYSVTSASPPRYSKSHRFRRARPAAGAGTRVRSLKSKFVVADHIKRAYLRTSFLFALSVLVTWIPSSMNRIHSWLTGESPFEYHVATAAVLPLQGLWNAVIFFVTSKNALRRSWWKWRGVDPTGCGEQRRREEEEEAAAMARRSAAVREVRLEEGDDDSGSEDEGVDDEEAMAGSDVELRAVAGAPGRKSSSSSS